MDERYDLSEIRHILIVDDTESIHDDLKKILLGKDSHGNAEVDNLENILFDEKPEVTHSFNKYTYMIDDAYNGEEAIEKITQAEESGNPYALVYMDVRMPPGINGIETIGKIWEKYPYVEMVICTAYSDYSWDKIVEKLGSTDRLLFLKKPVNTVVVQQMTLSLIKKWNLFKENRYLIRNLENEVKERTSQLENLLKVFEKTNEELAKKNRLLSDIVIRDSLTGLLNHAALHEQLEIAFSQAIRNEYSLSVIMLDIDYFKKFNDTFGHQVGDEILLKISDVLQEQFRPYDIKMKYNTEDEIEDSDNNKKLLKDNLSGRYGGDEFILILPYCGVDEAKKITDRLIEKFRALKINERPEIKVTTSVGVAVLEKGSACKDSKYLVALADNALYKSKKNGRDQVCILEYRAGNVN